MVNGDDDKFKITDDRKVNIASEKLETDDEKKVEKKIIDKEKIKIKNKEMIGISNEKKVNITGKNEMAIADGEKKLEITDSEDRIGIAGDEKKLEIADWEKFILNLSRFILEEQSPQRLLQVRGEIYELLSNSIEPKIIIKTLARALLPHLDDSLKHETIRWAAHYEYQMLRGNKPIFHLEAFVAKFMSIYKRWIIESF